MRRLALASCIALALVSATQACGSSDASSGSATGADGGSDVSVLPPPPPDLDPCAPDASPGPGVCPIFCPFDAVTHPWLSPEVDLGACTDADLALLVNYADHHPNATVSDLRDGAGLGATCTTCIFGRAGATSKPISESTPPTIAVANCIEIASGNDECGAVYQNYYDCAVEACEDCPDDPTSHAKCIAATAKGACKAQSAVAAAACGPTLSTYEKACRGSKYELEGPIRAQCINGLAPSDAGDDG